MRSTANQSAMRMMVPKFPGSRMESRARQSPSGFSIASRGGFFTTANMGEGVLRLLIRAITASPSSSRRTIFTISKPDESASCTIFSPSTTKSPKMSLNFFFLRLFIFFISLLVSMQACCSYSQLRILRKS